jgi:very-short-patch-repair endonuclease
MPKGQYLHKPSPARKAAARKPRPNRRGVKRPDVALRNRQRVWSDESKALQRDKAVRQYHNGQVVLRPVSPTYIEKLLINMLKAKYPVVIAEKPFGRYRVDAYIPPPYHLAYEADGEHWHDAAKDAIRDKYLLEQFNLPVIRFTGKELVRMSRGSPA